MVTLSSRRERVDQLALVLDGALSPDDARGDVRRLASLAGTVTAEIEPPRLDEAGRERIRTQLMAAVHADLHDEVDAARTGRVRAPRSARTAVATGVASLLIGTGGVAVAAQEALPGDTLYGIKQATESVRIAAAGDLTERGRLDLVLAGERLEEVTAAVARGGVRDEDLIATFQRMDARSRSGAETLARVAERSNEPELLDEIERFTERQGRGIIDVFDQLPVGVRPYAEDSLATLRSIRDDLLGSLGTGDVASAELTATIDSLLRSSPLPPGPALLDPTAPRSSSSTSEPSTDGGDEATAPDAPDVTDAEQPALPLPEPDGTTADDGSDLVPRLPEPLDEVGETVDSTIDGLVDGAETLLEDTTGAVDDVVDEVDDAVDDTVDETLGTLDGILGGSSTD